MNLLKGIHRLHRNILIRDPFLPVFGDKFPLPAVLVVQRIEQVHRNRARCRHRESRHVQLLVQSLYCFQESFQPLVKLQQPILVRKTGFCDQCLIVMKH